jgi:branched-chain amino acid transport system substrate-binding protein
MPAGLRVSSTPGGRRRGRLALATGLTVLLAISLGCVKRAPPESYEEATPGARPAAAPAPPQSEPAPAEEKSKAAESLLRKGEKSETAGKLATAREAYGALLARYPADTHADEARRRLADLDLRMRRYGDAEQGFRALYERTPPDEKPKVARSIALAAAGTGDYVESLRFWLEALALSQADDARTAARAQIQSIIDSRLSATEIARLNQELPANSPAIPALVFKRALILAHLGDGNAKSELQAALQRFPEGTAAPQARAALARLETPAEVKAGLVGVLLPQSPQSYAGYSQAALRGLKLAFGEDEKQLLVRDTKGDPAVAADQVRSLWEAGAQVIIGPILSAEAEAAAVAAQSLGIPIIALARTEGITAIGPYVFRNMLTDSAQAKALAHYAIDLKRMKRFAVLYPEVDYGKQMMALFWDRISEKGGRFRGAEGYPYDTTTFKIYAERLVGRADLELRGDWFAGLHQLNAKKMTAVQRKRAMRALRESLPPIVDFDALFIADSARNVSLIAPALAVENVITNGCDESEVRRIRRTTHGRVSTVQLLGWTAWYDPDFDLVARAGHYVECSVFVDGFFAQSARPDTKAFVEAYERANGQAPGLMEAEAYDTGRMVQKVLESKPATRDAFRQAFAGIAQFPGATGSTTIAPNREPEKPLFYVFVGAQGYEELDLGKIEPIDDGS